MPVVRANGEMVKSSVNVGSQVRLVAKPVKSTGTTAFVEAADGVNVVVKRPDASMLPDCAIEIVGTVNADRSVTEHSFVPFSSDFDMSAYNEFIKLANGRFRPLFE